MVILQCWGSYNAGDSPVIGRDGKAQQLNLIPFHLETTPQTHSPPVFLIFEPGTKERTDDSDCKGSGSSAGADCEGGGVGGREEYGEKVRCDSRSQL